jgi:nitrate/nitrite transporter NarK
VPAFWAIPEQFLQGPALAAGIAMINALANIAGFTGPYLMGYLYQQTGSHRLGLLALATIGAALSLVWLQRGKILDRPSQWCGIHPDLADPRAIEVGDQHDAACPHDQQKRR